MSHSIDLVEDAMTVGDATASRITRLRRPVDQDRMSPQEDRVIACHSIGVAAGEERASVARIETETETKSGGDEILCSKSRP